MFLHKVNALTELRTFQSLQIIVLKGSFIKTMLHHENSIWSPTYLDTSSYLALKAV